MKSRFYLLFAVSLFLSPTSSLYAKKYYLDASRAEEILSHLIRPRLLEKDWLDVVGDKKDSFIEVGPGDSLWRISKYNFGDAFLWRKLWHVNGFLGNPHELKIGERLKLYRGLAERRLAGEIEPPIIRIPLVKLSPGGTQNMETDSDSILNPDLRNQYRPQLVVVPEEDIYGTVSGGYAEGENFSETQNLYLELPRLEKVRVGDHFAVARSERALDSAIDGSAVKGTLMRLVGLIEVNQLGHHTVRASMRSHHFLVQRGDRVIEIPNTVRFSTMTDPPDDLVCSVRMGEFPERTGMAQGDIVLLDKGTDEGVQEGFLFRLSRNTDPYTDSESGVEPDFSAEVQVIYASPLASLGYILRNQIPVMVGDKLVANQLFQSPPPTHVRSFRMLEIE